MTSPSGNAKKMVKNHHDNLADSFIDFIHLLLFTIGQDNIK